MFRYVLRCNLNWNGTKNYGVQRSLSPSGFFFARADHFLLRLKVQLNWHIWHPFLGHMLKPHGSISAKYQAKNGPLPFNSLMRCWSLGCPVNFFSSCTFLSRGVCWDTVDGQSVQILNEFNPPTHPKIQSSWFLRGLRWVDKSETPTSNGKRLRLNIDIWGAVCHVSLLRRVWIFCPSNVWWNEKIKYKLKSCQVPFLLHKFVFQECAACPCDYFRFEFLVRQYQTCIDSLHSVRLVSQPAPNTSF